MTQNLSLEHPGVFFVWASCGLPSRSVEYVTAYFFLLPERRESEACHFVTVQMHGQKSV